MVLGIIGLTPFLFLFAGLTLLKMKSHIITISVFAATALLAFFFWNTSAVSIALYSLEGLLFALLPIVWVILAAVFTYFVSVETGAMETLKKYLSTLSPDPNIQAVVIAFCLGGFLESIAGFGTAVAIPTAMLMSLGFHPVKSAVIALVANSVPVAFGALGIPVIVLSQISSLNLQILTRYVAFQLLPFALLVPLAIVFISNGGLKDIKKSILDALFIGILFSLSQTLVAVFIGPELVAVAGSLISLAAFVLLKSLTSKQHGQEGPAAALRAVMNYIILLALVLITRLVFPKELAKPPFTLALPVGGHTFKLDYITTPGTLLLLSTFITALLDRLPIKKLLEIFFSTLNKIKWSAWTIINIVALAKVMQYSGMINSVAALLAGVSGKFFPLIAPLLGAGGTFVTGSDTSSNILLGDLQKQTALKIDANPEWITASNTAGATAGKMISPQSIAVAAATVGLQKQESEIIRTTALYCGIYVVLLGIYVYTVNLFLH